MISSFRKFAKTKFAGLLVFIMIIPFVFWGMGSMFSSGNKNNIAKINDNNISTQEFIDHIRQSNIPEKTIRDNLDKNIIEELLSNLISTSLLDMEIKDFNILITENTLSKKIKSNKNFLNENGKFERIKYEKFLLENNQSAPGFELRLRGRELQKNLFDYIGAGTTTPKFLAKKLFIKENRKLKFELINLESFYKKKSQISNLDIKRFISENEKKLKIDYINFDYLVINPINLIGTDEFNQTFFDKIDEIEIDISNNLDLNKIASKFNLKPIKVSNLRYSQNIKDIEKKIYEARNIKFDIIEDENNYILYKINNIEKKLPNIKDNELKSEIIELIIKKNKFEYNKILFDKINQKSFNDDDFKKMGQNKTELIVLNSIKDNNKFEINSVELLYSLPTKSYTLINDDKNNIYLAKVIEFEDVIIDQNDDKFKEYIIKQNSISKNNILKTYDLFLNEKYNVVLNQKTIERVKNFFQ